MLRPKPFNFVSPRGGQKIRLHVSGFGTQCVLWVTHSHRETKGGGLGPSLPPRPGPRGQGGRGWVRGGVQGARQGDGAGPLLGYSITPCAHIFYTPGAFSVISALHLTAPPIARRWNLSPTARDPSIFNGFGLLADKEHCDLFCAIRLSFLNVFVVNVFSLDIKETGPPFLGPPPTLRVVTAVDPSGVPGGAGGGGQEAAAEPREGGLPHHLRSARRSVAGEAPPVDR